MKQLFIDPFFAVGLALRLLLLFAIAPTAATIWYAPFIDSSLSSFSLDPWRVFLANGGDAAAFPYGYVMWLALLPLSAAAKLAGLPVIVGYKATLLCADVAVMLLLQRIINCTSRLLLFAYWLSPLVLYATYAQGFNDLIPVAILTLALLLIRRQQFALSGFVMAAAISAKMSMLIAVPFVFVYLANNWAFSADAWTYAKGLLLGVAVWCVPFLASSAAMAMLFHNPEIAKVYEAALPIGSGFSIYLVPLAYVLVLYAEWRFRRINFDLFFATLGIAFLMVVIFTRAAPGWYCWIMPLLVVHQARGGVQAIVLSAIFSVAFVCGSLLIQLLSASGGDAIQIGVWSIAVGEELGRHLVSLLHTAMAALGLIMAMQVWRQSVAANDFLRLNRKPFIIGIAGDSGSGKDTLALALGDLFGRRTVTQLSGDDYHRWDRQKPIWQVMTHLNPAANDLEAFAHDLLALADRRTIQSRHYDHASGKRQRPTRIAARDIIIASGLHALYLPICRARYDLSIYLDMDDELRRHYKIRRDSGERGHSVEHVLASLEKRAKDVARFVRPQGRHADLVMSLQPIHPLMLAGDSSISPRLKLSVLTRKSLHEMSLARVLVGVCGLHVDLEIDDDAEAVMMTIEGETGPEDVRLAATMLFPKIIEFLDPKAAWREGMLGVMQLVILANINQSMIRRLI
ncbi:hypothetical protein [Rhodopseudomonas telluris]|uniref:Phosphoribulokinase n=1 Tax=Rhodopseudomonas telluris TaxID=644215 RepID=A0ABV6EPG7_9BRAD